VPLPSQSPVSGTRGVVPKVKAVSTPGVARLSCSVQLVLVATAAGKETGKLTTVVVAAELAPGPASAGDEATVAELAINVPDGDWRFTFTTRVKVCRPSDWARNGRVHERGSVELMA